MTKRPWLPSFGLVGLLGLLAVPAASGPAAAQEVVIKLGTLAPVGSSWHVLLKEGAEKFREVSGGQVTMKVYAGGTMGNEGDMVKKMRIGSLQAAALSTVGLHEITPEPLAIDLPLLVKTTEERDYLMSKVSGRLETALAKAGAGFVVMSWSEIGFTRFFTTKPRPTLAAMRQGKLFVWEGDPASADAMKKGGFNPVVLSATDIIPSLQTGMIDTVVYPPSYALALRLHEKAKFMQDLVWTSFAGAIVIDKKTWERIPADLRPKLQAIAKELGRRTVTAARKLEDDAMTKMKAQGLEVVKVADASEWQKAVDAANEAIRGKVVPADLFDEVHRLIKEYRANKTGAANK